MSFIFSILANVLKYFHMSDLVYWREKKKTKNLKRALTCNNKLNFKLYHTLLRATKISNN